MTIPFPHDPQLPQLQQLLDSHQMSRIISEALGINVDSCTPKYVRYKPNTSCIVQYEMRFSCENSEPITQSAHIKVYADHRAEAKATGSRAGRLDKRLENLQPDAPKVTYLPEVDGAFQIYPADLDLRSLARVADSNGAEREIKKALGLSRSPELSTEPELIRYKPGRKALLRYQVDEVSDLPLYGKVFENQSVSDMRNITDALIAAGLPTARVLGIVEEHKFIVHESVPGIALNEMRQSPEYLQWIEPLADALWQLQSIDLPSLPEHDLSAEIATLREVQTQISTLLPHLAPRLETLVRHIEQGLEGVDDILVTSHGDFYDDQSLVGEDGLSLIDLEAMRRSHPLLDAGNMLAHFSAGAKSPEGNLSAARRVFLDQTNQHFNVNESVVRLFEAAGILKLAPGPFRRLEENWSRGVERLISLAEMVLEINSTSSIIDPALPQLQDILDVNKMSDAISAVLEDDQATLKNVELVRHKPGRRAILRFDLSDSTALYGKTFASKRGPKVFTITEKLSTSRAFGPDVLTPDAVAYLSDSKLMLLSEVSGEPIENQLCAGDTDLAERIAFALFHLHSSNVDLGRWHDMEKELSPLDARCADIMKHASALSDEAEDLLIDLMSFDHHAMCWRFRPIHRDMYHDQVLMAKEKLVVLDLDDASMSEPAIDVANFATHLMLLGLQKAQDAEAYRPLIDAFLNQYAELDPDLDSGLVDYLTATTALRLAGIHVSRANGVEVARGLLAIVRRYLGSAWKAAA